MRTFHLGGTAQGGAEQNSIEASIDGTIKIRNRNAVINKDGRPVVLSRNMEVTILDADDREKAAYKVPYGTILLADDGDKVKGGQKLAEWDPYTTPIITEKGGKANYMDLVDGVSMREVTDEVTGITSRVAVSYTHLRAHETDS